MNSPQQRIKIGALSLACVFIVSVMGLHWIGGYDWLDSLWMVVITVSTVGFSEKKNVLPPETQLLIMGVIVLGVSASAYTFGALIQYLLEGEFDRVLGKRKMHKEIAKLTDHVIICGYGRLGEDLGDMLKKRNLGYVIVDNDPERVEDGRAEGNLVVLGDATDESVLVDANIGDAKTIVTTLPTDAQNVFIALTARNMCPSVQIIATAEHSSSCKKLRQAGADKIVMLHRTGAQQMERMISRPTTARLFDVFAETTAIEMEMDELLVPDGCLLAGKQLGETNLRDKYNLLVVGIKQSSGDMLFNPSPKQCIDAGDTLMLMGQLEQIELLKKSAL
jgi:voltage-gated potassium channel